jgi:MerR family mercuric resistance operon transcriptional regulator
LAPAARPVDIGLQFPLHISIINPVVTTGSRGHWPAPGRTDSGYRQYDSYHEQRLYIIVRSRTLGFSIDDLKGLLDPVDRRAVTCAEVRSTAEKHLAAVRDKIADLGRMERALDDTIRSCSGADVSDCPLIDTLFGMRSV